MAPKVADDRLNEDKRPRVSAPHVPLSVLRKKMRLTLEAVCERIYEETGMRPERGTLSAIENGHRGASAQMIEALALVYDIPVSAIDTQYSPRNRQGAVE
ncbi:helix-turn-helix domain-containing protein [Nocardia sp. Marseille-Q1738]